MARICEWSQRPTTAQYVAGLAEISPRVNDIQRRILAAQYRAPKRTAYATQLAIRASVRGGHPAVNAQYGRLGHMFCDATGLEPDQRKIGTSRWWAVWSRGYSTPKGFIWEMLPEVAEALELLGWVAPEAFASPDELSSTESLVEGAALRVSVNAYERNPEARQRCIEIHESRCCICGFDFGSIYGSEFAGFIHVHHLRPLSEIRGEYEVDPLEDLRPICPNCHAVIHHGGRLRNIEEVRQLLVEQGQAKQSAAADGAFRRR